jgi:hypothetical protein
VDVRLSAGHLPGTPRYPGGPAPSVPAAVLDIADQGPGLTAAHGGTATVESAPGQGATFRVTLPLAPDAGQADETDEPEADEEPQHGLAGNETISFGR